MTKAEEILEKHLANNIDQITYLRGSKLTYSICIDALNEAINYTRYCTELLCVSDDFNFITKGVTYKMEDEPDGNYVIIDDLGESRLLWKHYFEIVK